MDTVKSKDKLYSPIEGVAMGTCHAFDFSDVWVGDLVQEHVDTCPVDTLMFTIYRDDGLDLLLNRDILEFKNHPNIKFSVHHGKEGEYLDLRLMLKEKFNERCI